MIVDGNSRCGEAKVFRTSEEMRASEDYAFYENRIGKMSAELTRLKAIVEELETVRHIAQLYWNGEDHAPSMREALTHIKERAAAAQLRVKEIREGKDGA